jgi:hypothetical protein
MALENTGDPIANDSQLTEKERRAQQARINGRKSHGPISPEGKAKSSKNAIRHGLTANEHTLLAAELPDEYEEVRLAFIDDLRPATKAELRLVEKIANLDWRLERFVMMETCVLNMETGINADKIMERFERIDGIGFIVEAWKESLSASHCLDLLRRYLGTLQHQFNSTLANFRNFEKARLARTRGGTDLDVAWGPPYQAPSFETHSRPIVDERLANLNADLNDDAPAQSAASQPNQAPNQKDAKSSPIELVAPRPAADPAPRPGQTGSKLNEPAPSKQQFTANFQTPCSLTGTLSVGERIGLNSFFNYRSHDGPAVGAAVTGFQSK